MSVNKKERDELWKELDKDSSKFTDGCATKLEQKHNKEKENKDLDAELLASEQAFINECKLLKEDAEHRNTAPQSTELSPDDKLIKETHDQLTQAYLPESESITESPTQTKKVYKVVLEFNQGVKYFDSETEAENYTNDLPEWIGADIKEEELSLEAKNCETNFDNAVCHGVDLGTGQIVSIRLFGDTKYKDIAEVFEFLPDQEAEDTHQNYCDKEAKTTGISSPECAVFVDLLRSKLGANIVVSDWSHTGWKVENTRECGFPVLNNKNATQVFNVEKYGDYSYEE